MHHAAPSRFALPPAWVSIAVAIAFAAALWNVCTTDTDTFLLPWMRHIVAHGPIGAFAAPFSNYSPPYLYLLAAASPLVGALGAYTVVKLVSFAALLCLALAARRLLTALGHAQPGRAAAVLALAPTVFLNPAFLNQCDALWTAALLLALAGAIERRHVAMMAWCGVAVAIKLQAGFAAPFFLALLLARRTPVRVWALAPLAVLLMLAPAWAAGWPASDLLTIYLRQTRWFDAISLNAPNIWMIVQTVAGAAPAAAGQAATALTLLAVGGYVLLFRRGLASADGHRLLAAALLCALIVPGLLPRMHERFFFLADVLALLLMLARPAAWRPALYTQIGSGLAILAYLSGVSALAAVGALAMLAATWFAAHEALGLGTRRAVSRSCLPA